MSGANFGMWYNAYMYMYVSATIKSLDTSIFPLYGILMIDILPIV